MWAFRHRKRYMDLGHGKRLLIFSTCKLWPTETGSSTITAKLKGFSKTGILSFGDNRFWLTLREISHQDFHAKYQNAWLLISNIIDLMSTNHRSDCYRESLTSYPPVFSANREDCPLLLHQSTSARSAGRRLSISETAQTVRAKIQYPRKERKIQYQMMVIG
jgi:hypothetical protein